MEKHDKFHLSLLDAWLGFVEARDTKLEYTVPCPMPLANILEHLWSIAKSIVEHLWSIT